MPSLDPAILPQYAAPTVIPPAMPKTRKLSVRSGKNIDYYEIAVRQFQQQILPAGYPRTTVCSYGSANHPWSFNYPAFTIEARWRAPVRVKWMNELLDPVTGNFLPQPVLRNHLLMSPAERADVIVDFTHVPAGTELILLNLGPDEPFGGGVPDVDFPAADPNTTGQVMQFRVVLATSVDLSTPPQQLILPRITPIGMTAATRQVSLNVRHSETLPDVGPRDALLGTVDAMGMPMPMMWDEPETETPTAGTAEVWEMFNHTTDAHPIHLHNVQFQVVDRQAFDRWSGMPSGAARPPEIWESGFKDTVIAYPGEVTRVKSRFPTAGLFVRHCHIVEHEDNEMMRPYRILPAPGGFPGPGTAGKNGAPTRGAGTSPAPFLSANGAPLQGRASSAHRTSRRCIASRSA